MKTINILGVPNGVGISRDIELIKGVLLNAGYDVQTNHAFNYVPKHKVDLNIFLERFSPKLFSSGNKNVLIPNQEWFEPGWLPMLPSFDYVFVKTRFAEEVFKNLGSKTEFISFTSEDRYLPDIKKSEYHFIHVAGKSIQKQTETVIRTWSRNIGFPQLTIIRDPKFYSPRSTVRNVNFVWDRVPEDLLKVMQNSSSVHVCPSETEGFGHYIMEAMSCKSLALITKAPPMTELVAPDRGVYVDFVREEPMRLSKKFIISEDTLEKAVIDITIMDWDVRQKMGEKARAFFLDNDLFFRKRLPEAVETVLNS